MPDINAANRDGATAQHIQCSDLQHWRRGLRLRGGGWCGARQRHRFPAAIAAGAAPPPGLARCFSSRMIAVCLATSARSSTTAARKDASDLAMIQFGPQKFRPASSPVVIIRMADIGFGSGGFANFACPCFCKNPKKRCYVAKRLISMLREFDLK